MTTVIEWAFRHPGLAISHLALTVGFLILFIPGAWLWMDKGVLPMRKRWRDTWDYWPRAHFMESVFVTLGWLLLLLLLTRLWLFLLGIG